MKEKFYIVLLLCMLVACGGSNKSTSSSSEEVSYSSTDYSLTYYLPQNISKIQRDEPYTTDDLKESRKFAFLLRMELLRQLNFQADGRKSIILQNEQLYLVDGGYI